LQIEEKTNWFDNKIAPKKSNKNESSFFLGTKTKIEGVGSQKKQGFDNITAD